MAVALDAPSLHGVDAAMYDTGAQKSTSSRSASVAERSRQLDWAPQLPSARYAVARYSLPLTETIALCPRSPLRQSSAPAHRQSFVCGCAGPSRLHTAGIKTIVGADGHTHWEQPPRAELDGRSTLTTAQKQQLYRDGYVSPLRCPSWYLCVDSARTKPSRCSECTPRCPRSGPQ